MNKVFAVYGASGFGREIMPIVKSQYKDEGFDFVFVDDDINELQVNGVNVLTFTQYVELPATFKSISIAVADSKIRKELAFRCKQNNISIRQVRASNSVLMDDVSIGEGGVISHFVTITSNVKIGMHFHGNLYSYVAHDCVIGDYVTFAPSVKCNGNIEIGNNVYVGTGAILKQGRPGVPLTIGSGAIVGMGAVVTKNVAPNSVVVGNPAKTLVKRGV